MSEFKTHLVAEALTDTVWVIHEELVYESDEVGLIIVPGGFQTDFASVPRLPVVYEHFGDRAHHESVIHDYLYRSDSFPTVARATADAVFLSAMAVRGKSWGIRYPMYWGVRMGGAASYHRRKVADQLI